METRVLFLDKLRSAVILGVVVFHSAVGYSGSAPFWPFRGEELGRGLDLLLYLADIVMMPLMFFIAGYFALPSYERRGGWAFIKPKLLRLGLPWLAISFLLLPVLDYLHYLTRLGGNLDLISYLLQGWQRMCTPMVGFLDMHTYIPLIDQYYQRYMWFISLLLCLYLLYPVLHRVVAGRRASGPTVDSDAKPRTGRALVWLGLAAFGLSFLALGVLRTGMNWFSLGNILQFQPVKLAYYLCLFAFGAWCAKRQLLQGRGLFSRSWPLGLISLALLVPAFAAGMVLSHSESPALWMKLAYAGAYTAITLSSVLYFLTVGQRKWHKPSRFWSWVSGFSYEIYLVHYAWVLTIPLLFRNLPGMPGVAKFLAVALISLIGSIGTAYCLKLLGRKKPG